MRRLIRFALVVVVVASVSAQSGSLPVVPGGFGYGMDTRAAYGADVNPTIYKVTNLQDSGRGSLRDAMLAPGPRVVIFEISGTIALASAITVTTPYLTVAAQTAPSPGIALRNDGIQIRTHDVLLQHFRVRPGWADRCTDGLGTYPAASNIVLDHMSVSWGQDENIYVYPGLDGGDTNLTFWRSITSENLSYAGATSSMCNPSHPQGEPGHGFLVTNGATRVAMIQSLTAHNEQRNPLIQNGASMAMLNNVVYDWYKEWGFVAESRDSLPEGAWHATVVGNRFIRGPSTVNPGDGNYANLFYYANDSGQRGNTIYRKDNTVGNDDGRVVMEDNGMEYDPNVSAPPREVPMPSGYVPLDSAKVEAFVLANAGARPVDRDPVDTRVVREVRNRTGGFISNQGAVGGWPDLKVNQRPLDVPDTPHKKLASGYTVLEEWLHQMADEVEGNASAPMLTAPAGLTNLSVY